MNEDAYCFYDWSGGRWRGRWWGGRGSCSLVLVSRLGLRHQPV